MGTPSQRRRASRRPRPEVAAITTPSRAAAPSRVCSSHGDPVAVSTKGSADPAATNR